VNYDDARGVHKSIITCFLRRCEVGTHHWAQCNDVPVKYARFPVTRLVEGRSYTFRVRALNQAGVSRPSRVSEAVVAMDPTDRARLRGERHAGVLPTHCNTQQLALFQIYIDIFIYLFSQQPAPQLLGLG